MEQQEEISSSKDAVKGDEAPASFIAAARSENPSELTGSTMPPPPAVAATPVSVAMPGAEVKKKRGRPRKYGPGGSAIPALSPMPISASIPLTGEFSAWKQGRGRSINSVKKKHKLEFGSPGEWASYFVGANFTPHVITVYTGEDVSMKILSFSQQESRAVCVLSANGAISNVTLRQANSCGGTLTYEGRFEILSLTGSFIPSDGGGTRSRSGGMSVSLAGPDGRVFGGGLAGLLVAAGAVQVVIGSFSPGHRQAQKPKKQRFEHTINFSLPPANLLAEPAEVVYGGPKPNITPPSSFHGDNMGTPISFQVSKNLANENETSLPRAEPKGPNLQDREISC